MAAPASGSLAFKLLSTPYLLLQKTLAVSWCMILNEQWALVLVAACDDRRQFASDDLNTESGFLSPRFLESGSTSVVTNIPLTRSLVWIDHRMPCFSELSYLDSQLDRGVSGSTVYSTPCRQTGCISNQIAISDLRQTSIVV